ncbi:MAG: hypothetical protein ACOY40_01105 [Bacillota bacterium]
MFWHRQYNSKYLISAALRKRPGKLAGGDAGDSKQVLEKCWWEKGPGLNRGPVFFVGLLCQKKGIFHQI